MEIKIEKLVYGGDGLGRHEGQAVFVPFVLPEEVVRVAPVERKKDFTRARVEQLLTPSPRRAAAACPHFGVCGGCHYQHIPYQAQLEYKVEILRETLHRIGHINWEEPIHTHPSPPFGYRNRAQWEIQPKVEGSPAAIGYHQAGSSALCAVDQCPILSLQLAATLRALKEWLAQDANRSALTEVEAFADAADEKILLNVSLDHFDGTPAALSDALHAALPGIETLLLHERQSERMELFGPGYIRYEAGGNRFRVGHLSFFQTNRFLVEELARTVVAEAQGELALDLYAGVGLFTLPLAKQFARVMAIEANPAAARDLQANIKAAGARAEPVQAEAAAFLARGKETPDLVVLDPPRTGLASRLLVRLADIAPARIHYLSCNPATLARDLGMLTGPVGHTGKYAISDVHLFDLFPQTFHIESLVVLRRRE